MPAKPAPLILAPPEKIARLAELRERLRQQEAEQLRHVDVFGLLGYEPTPKQQIFHDATEFDVLFGGSSGGGKGGRCPDRTSPSYDVSMETKVLTPKGFKLFGDIRPGDQVCNPDGTVARVIRVTDNGPKQFYRVTLADGSSVEADEDHLWAMTVSAQRRRRKSDVPVIPAGLRPEDEWNLRVQSRCKIVSTVELRELVLRGGDDKARGDHARHVLLPLTMPVNLTAAKGRWPVFSPYILGALIGDGSMGGHRSVSITGIDEEIFDRIRAELPDGLTLVERASDRTCPQYAITRKGAPEDAADPGALGPFIAEMKRLRAGRNCSQRDLAALTGITQSYICSIEAGRVWPGSQVAERIDRALDADARLFGLYAHRGAGESAQTLLTRDGLYGLHSWDKFIPERLKTAPAADRFAFMQGLMDTDGHMDERGHVELVTVSERLAKDAQEVLRSLGYRATLTTKTPTYTHNGEKREGRLAYRLYIQGRHLDRLFHMTRKRERVTRYNGGDIEPWHRVVSVEPTAVDNSKCITVDNLNHLYVTDDYIVTHNSVALVAEAIRACVRYPGIRVGAFRRTYPELKESLLAELSTTFRFAGALGAKWNGNEYELRFPNGSVVMFRYAETLKDATRRQGGQFQLLIFDERTLTPPDVIAFLESRLRSGRAEIPVLGIRSSANPGGSGHGSVKARYITATNFGADVITDERGRTVRFIPSRLSDNPHVNPEYAADLLALPEKLRAAFLDGNWDVFSGQMFPELSRDRHVIDPVHLPATWTRYNGIDWGFANPFAVLWAAVDEDQRVWFYRETYAAGVGEAEQARRILAAEAEDERISARYADDAMWAARGDAKAISDVYSENGVHLTRAAKGSRVVGWQRVRSYLAEKPACPHHRAMGWETCPGLHMFSTLSNFYRSLADLPHAESGDPEDADTHGDDHLPDAARYLLINLGGGAQSWIDWAKRKAAAVAAAAPPPDDPAPLPPPVDASLAKCRKPDCMRKVRHTVAYCCLSCSTADAGGYELSPHDPSAHWVLSHSADCEERSAGRGEVTPAEERILDSAATLRAARTAMFRQQAR